MSNLWFNIRFGFYHWSWGPDGMNWNYNSYQAVLKEADSKMWKWFEIYAIFGYHI